MTSRTLRFASRLCGALLFILLAHVAAAQPPKDPPKDSPKEPLKATPEEQKAKEAFVAGKLDDALKALQAAAKTNPTMAPPKVIAARWCVETKQGQQARLLIEQAASEDPAHPEVLLTNASFALGEGRITDTILSCIAALQATREPAVGRRPEEDVPARGAARAGGRVRSCAATSIHQDAPDSRYSPPTRRTPPFVRSSPGRTSC